jgi:peptidoglycan/LPS O-acetylase OafA/YrhL
MTMRNSAIPTLDGVRGLAVLFVLFCHTGYSQYSFLIVGLGTLGVMLFYTLSGFLMAYHYLPEDFNPRYWVSFLIHRFIRVYPAFVIATFGYLFLPRGLPPDFPAVHPGDWHTLTSSWLLKENGGVFWTIPVELKFYVFYPLLALAFVSLNFRVFVGVTVISWIALIGAAFLPEHIWMLRYFAFFLVGAFAGVYFKKIPPDEGKPIHWDLAAAALLLVLMVCIDNFFRFDISGKRLWIGAWLFAPLLAMTIFSVGRSRGVILWLFANPVSRWIGRISYSLYLVHWTWINLIQQAFPSRLQNSWFVFGSVFLVAYIFYWVVERPFTLLAKNISARLSANWVLSRKKEYQREGRYVHHQGISGVRG